MTRKLPPIDQPPSPRHPDDDIMPPYTPGGVPEPEPSPGTPRRDREPPPSGLPPKREP